jgi:glycosyltransferase involved in cell wall biosynthesis
MKMASKKILIIIPAYNEEKSIANVLRSLDSQQRGYVCAVINDGSVDSTQEAAERTGLGVVIRLPSNIGIGGAVQTGFKYGVYNDFDLAVQFDGDGQHLAEEIPKILGPIEAGLCDACIGSRFLEKTTGFQSTFARRMGIRLLEVVNYMLSGQKVTDSTSGFRAYNREAIKFLSQNYPTDYPEPETLVLLGKNHFSVKEVSVQMIERQDGVSSISGFRSVYYMLKVILAMLMASRREQVRMRDSHVNH